MEKLNRKQQAISVCLSIVFCLEMLASIYLLHYLTTINQYKQLSACMLFLVICIGGFLGGATRALNMLIINLNHETIDQISARLSRWFLYLIKPFVGIGGGLAFFLAANMGLLTVMKSNSTGFDFYGILLVSFTGGMFFEDVFKRLHSSVFKEKKNIQLNNQKPNE